MESRVSSCVVPKISLVAWEARLLEAQTKFIFVAVPNERGRYVRTDPSVAFVGCPHCEAIAGEPCKDKQSGRYCSGTHVRRRGEYTRARNNGEIISPLYDVDYPRG